MTSTKPEARTQHAQIVAKTALLIVVIGATGVGLLAERQRRFEAAHTMTVAHRRADVLEREIRKLRAEIASRLTPERIDTRVEAAAGTNEPLQPILWSMRPAHEQATP